MSLEAEAAWAQSAPRPFVPPTEARPITAPASIWKSPKPPTAFGPAAATPASTSVTDTTPRLAPRPSSEAAPVASPSDAEVPGERSVLRVAKSPAPLNDIPDARPLSPSRPREATAPVATHSAPKALADHGAQRVVMKIEPPEAAAPVANQNWRLKWRDPKSEAEPGSVAKSESSDKPAPAALSAVAPQSAPPAEEAPPVVPAVPLPRSTPEEAPTVRQAAFDGTAFDTGSKSRKVASIATSARSAVRPAAYESTRLVQSAAPRNLLPLPPSGGMVPKPGPRSPGPNIDPQPNPLDSIPSIPAPELKPALPVPPADPAPKLPTDPPALPPVAPPSVVPAPTLPPADPAPPPAVEPAPPGVNPAEPAQPLPSPDRSPAAPLGSGPCGRTYNDRNCCDESKKCEESRVSLKNSPIRAISLDITPPFKPESSSRPESRETPEQKKATQLAQAAPRDWRDRWGKVLASGRITDFRSGRVIVTGTDGVTTAVPFQDLSDDDLCFVTAWWNLPGECKVADERYVIRDFLPLCMTWKATALCNKPLYFEQVQIERYGHTAGPLLEPWICGAHFFSSVALLPYNVGMDPPWECQYPLGYYRPGSCAPWLIPPVPLSIRGGLLQAGLVTGGVFIIP